MGWPGKLRESLFGPRPEDLARASIAAVNARDYATLRRLLSSRFRYRDRDGNLIETPAAFIAALAALAADAPDFRLEVDSFSCVDGTVLMRGRTVSAKRVFCSNSVWRLEVRHGRIRSLESFHANEAMKLHGFAPR